MSVYNFPKYYDIAFSFRRVVKDVDFLEQVMNKYGIINGKRILEMACGNCPYLKEWNKRGYRYTGVELNREMVRFAREVITKEKYIGEIIEANMVEFDLASEVFDMAYVLLGSIYVKSNEEFRNHLKCVGKSLKKGGLYILESVVLEETVEAEAVTWVRSKDGVKVEVFYNAEKVDEKKQLQNEHIKLKVTDNNEKFVVESKVLQKYFFRKEFEDLIKDQGGFEVCVKYLNFDMRKTCTKYNREIYVLRKK
jgi:cyclopropane fatty-acyl-phospholipid synthase-like methyltransferase